MLSTTETITVKDIFSMKENKAPESVLWHSILYALESCNDYNQLETIAIKLKDALPELKPRNESARYCPISDKINKVAQSEIPPDGPVHLKAISTISDGNCYFKALNKSFYNDDRHHVELRARTVLEGVINKDNYLSDNCLERGASCVHGNADLPTVFATFSEFYTPGQKLTPDTITAIYCLEMNSCS